jgi:transcriptional regulator with XRE-family HTH domain
VGFDQARLVQDIRARRARLGLSQRTASKQAGLGPTTISRVERGNPPDVKTLAQILLWLDLPANRYFEQRHPSQQVQPDMVINLPTGGQLLIEVKRQGSRPDEIDQARLEDIIAAAFEALAGSEIRRAP